MKILHFAIENYARIPFNLVKSEKKLGHQSYLAIPYKPKNHFMDEDYCLNLPFIGSSILHFLKRLTKYKRLSNSNTRAILNNHTWNPENSLNQFLFSLRDLIWGQKVRDFLKKIEIESFDLLVLDGGAGFLRNGKIVKELQKKGLKILITYCGSDFRTRGPIQEIERMADYRLTFEHDHNALDPSLDFYFAPYSFPDYYKPKPIIEKETIRIGHAPTNRLAKGTDAIIEALYEIKKRHQIEIEIIENQPHEKALSLKNSCNIFIDNIGEIGYGINSLESLYMGIPTAVQIMPDLEELIPDHPFININKDNIVQKLTEVIESNKLRNEYSLASRNWVLKYHNSDKICQKILEKIYD